MQNRPKYAVALAAVLSIRMWAGAAVLPTLYHWDLRSLANSPYKEQYDYRHFAACVQGLVNRDAPRFFVSYTDEDFIWFNRLRESGGLCEGWPVQTINFVTEVVPLFRSYINGVILYDPDPDTGVISTSLVATTAAGVEGAIAVRKDNTLGSLYRYLCVNTNGAKLPVLIDLTDKFTGTGTIWDTNIPSTGSRKCDAYLWAKQKYLDAGRCDTTKLMYTLDLWGCRPNIGMRSQLPNLDYAVKHKVFCFELSPWGDEAPNDDKTQPLGTDLNTYKAILNACNVRNNYSKMIKFCGFVNWMYKYTKTADPANKHEDVPTEWEMVRIQTAYNAYQEAEALDKSYLANASFYGGFLPLLETRRYVQNPAPTYNDLVAKGYINGSTGAVNNGHYILMYMGDYDSVAWPLYWMVLDKFDTPQRGQIDCSWALNPNTVDRGFVVMDYVYRKKSPRDFFIGGDSGAGYVHPTQLYGTRNPSGYGSAVSMWKEHCTHYYRLFDYSITGFLLNAGSGGTMTNTDVQNFAPFSGDGVGLNDGSGISALVGNVPARIRQSKDNPSASDIAAAYTSGVRFNWWRTVLWDPAGIINLQNQLGSQHKFVDAYTFYYLYRHHNGGNNNYRATWVSDTIPRILETSSVSSVQIIVRNDGWDTWSETASNPYRLAYTIVPFGATPTNDDYDANGRFLIPTGVSVSPGQSIAFTVSITAPSAAGTYDLYYDMVREGVTWFRGRNNIPWKKKVVVAASRYDIDTDGDGVPDVLEDQAGTLWWHPDDAVVCGDVGALAGDISGPVGQKDCYVNAYDLLALAAQWLWTGDGLTADIGGPSGVSDQRVDLYDFSRLALQWFMCVDPYHRPCWQ